MANLDDLISNIGHALSEAPYQEKEFARDLGQKAVSKIKDYTPVESGHLRDSLHNESTDDTVAVASSANYALFVEEGHMDRDGDSFVKGQWMFQKGMDDLMNDSDGNDFFDFMKIVGD